LVLHTYILRVQYSCDVVLDFWFWREMVFDITYVLSVQYSCAAVSDFLVEAVNSSQNENMFLQKNLIGLLYYDPIANVCIYKTKHSFLCNFLFFIFLLYCADLQVEVQIRILLKDNIGNCVKNANTGNHTLIS
jgi:hypothetical protein